MKNPYTILKRMFRIPALFCLSGFLLAGSASGQVKIYIVTDLEGASGVYKFAQTREKDSPSYTKSCEYLMGDIAAVVRGLKDGGADEIVVLDGHGSQAFVPDLMEPGAKYITGLPRPGTASLSTLDSSFTAMVLVGYHSMMGTPDGVLNHTQSSMTENRYWYNGVESGEIAQMAIIAGYYGIPTIMVTGDEAAGREARKFLGDKIVTVTVKKGLSRESAILYPFRETRKALYEGAKRAVKIIPLVRPYKINTPVNVRVQYLNLDPNLPKPELVTTEGVAKDALHILNVNR